MGKKIVISTCYGGFGLSETAMIRYAELKGLTLYPESGTCGMTTFYTVPKESRTPDIRSWRDATREQLDENIAAIRRERLYDREIPRDDADLIAVVEELGSEKASGKYAELKVVEIPDDVEWEIDEYDGFESIEEVHRSWG